MVGAVGLGGAALGDGGEHLIQAAGVAVAAPVGGGGGGGGSAGQLDGGVAGAVPEQGTAVAVLRARAVVARASCIEAASGFSLST